MFNLTRHRLFKMAASVFLSFTLLFVSSVQPALALVSSTAQYPVDNIDGIIADVPTGERWLQHLEEDLLPFWEMDEALGDPVGNYPTYRCNDGSLYSWRNPCPELENADSGIVKLDREYIRAKSRQIFAYGVAYHLTGKSKYLQFAKDGVDYLREYGLDPEGGAYTYFEDGVGLPSKARRISQDMAYAVAGLGFYYYLTRDTDVLADIVALKDYIFETYYDAEWDLLAWAHEDYVDYVDENGNEQKVSKDQRELVAQLDQVYGYMLLLTPTLPEMFDGKPLRSQWEDDLVHLATIMSEQFYTPDNNIFFGAITDPSKQRLGTDHTDFGHSIKTLWLIYEIGKLTGHYELTAFAQEKAPLIFEEAFLEDGTWGRRINQYGQLETDKEWWILAELDQTAATFSLRDPSYAKYLPTSYAYWFKYMIDHEHGGTWHWVSAKNNLPDLSMPKQHSWKNAFHSFEHDLVGYITGQAIHNLPVTLYFAFQEIPENTQIRPYLFAAKVQSMIEPRKRNGKKIRPVRGSTQQMVTLVDVR
ncbi:AGE family epimerase/isomerase [Okeania sp. SIO2C9]|uniref:AGE family epimerase/isomerase n=1 Tax=Okeania sp. SIO2C9 TaxID=2607791 RepID=UPI0025F59437|nr:AGE family epimerase/isomerase [Okeania sp. SIO2C9]